MLRTYSTNMRRFPFALAISLLALGSAARGEEAAVKPAPLPPIHHRAAIIGHRGGRALAPENTLAAFRNAIHLGADFVEIDLRTTKDGGLVIMHDSSVDRTTNGKGEVADLDLAALRNLDAGSKFSPANAGEKIPTFDEVLDLCKGKINIYLDFKRASVPQSAEAIRRHGMTGQVIVYAGVETLREWKRIAPEIPVMPTLPTEYRRENGAAEFRKLFPAEILEGNAFNWNADLVQQAHRAGAKVFLDALGPFDYPEGFRKLLEWGVDGIQTDHPDQLISALK